MLDEIHQGDCLELMRRLPDASVDAIVSDPPSAIGFMSAKWDSDKGGRKQWCAYMEERFAEALRVCKPGAHALVWALPRTSHWTATALEDAGWEIRDIVNHTFGCLDPETKAVTPNGSIHYRSLEEGSLVLCYDLESKTYSYQPVQAVYEYDYEDTAYRFVGDFGEIIVSRNHRCIVERDGKEICIEAESLQREENIPILENLSELQSTLGSKNKRTGYEKFLLWNELCQASSFSRQNRSIQDTRSHLQGLRQKFSPEIEGSDEKSKVLQLSVQRRGKSQRPSNSISSSIHCVQGASWMVRRVLQGKGDAVDGRKEPFMERWSDLHKKKRKSWKSINKVCEMSRGFYRNGKKRWLCDGTSFNSRKKSRSLFTQVGSRSSCESQRRRQPTREFDVVQDKFRPQAIRSRAKCNPSVVRIEPFHYSGKVWCIKVPTGFFVAERNGVVFPTGNSGFPKSLDIGKKIDEMAGVDREVVGERLYGELGNPRNNKVDMGLSRGNSQRAPVTSPATPEAKQWDGWGSGLKPSHENWILCRKPIENTIAQNVLTHGVGGINIDACRVEYANNYDQKHQEDIARGQETATNGRMFGSSTTKSEASSLVMKGRWPSNLVFSHLPECSASACADGCAVAELDAQGGARKSGAILPHHQRVTSKEKNCYGKRKRAEENYPASEGTASRYFPNFHYFPKASPNDRSCNKVVENNHPTVKNRDLMRWLVRLITPPGGVVLDMFGGSGSTAIACIEEGVNYILLEQEPEFVAIAKARVAAVLGETEPSLSDRVAWLETQVKATAAKVRKLEKSTGQLSLFDVAG